MGPADPACLVGVGPARRPIDLVVLDQLAPRSPLLCARDQCQMLV